MTDDPAELVNVRYMVDDVERVDRLLHPAPRLQRQDELRTGLRGRHPRQPAAPAERADELGGPTRCPTAGSRHRADGTASTSSSRTSPPRWSGCAGAGLTFRNDIVTGPGGRQILLEDPSGNVVELFQPAGG